MLEIWMRQHGRDEAVEMARSSAKLPKGLVEKVL